METIHLILGKANPERMNGVNRVVNEMATNQVLLGYAVQVWGISASQVHDYPQRNFKTVLYKTYKNPFALDPQLKKAFLLKKGKIVVHLHGAFIPRFYSVAMFLYRNQIPYIITPHSTYNKVMMKKNAIIKKVYFNLFEKKLLNHTACVHLLGKTEWEGLDAIYNNRKSVMIPYGFTPAPIIGSNPKPEIFTVVYCGRIAIYPKGLDIMMEGFSRFHQRYNNSVMKIIGDGKEKAALEQLGEKLGLKAAVVFTGSLFANEKVKALKQSHVFAHPSRTDGLPATIVEAAALGLPCIVSEATNTGDYISHYNAGYTMPELNAERFCAGLEDQYQQIMVQHQGKLLEGNAIRMVAEVFNWQKILNQFSKIYEQALAGNFNTAPETIQQTMITVR